MKNIALTQECSALIGSVYRSIPDTSLWINFLEKAAHFFDVAGAQIMCVNLTTEKVVFNSCYGIDSREIDNLEPYIFQDPAALYALENPSKVYSDRKLPNIDTILDYPVSKNFLQKVGITERIAFCIVKEDVSFAFALLSGPDRALFTDDELELVSVLQPHIVHAAELQQNLLQSRYTNKLLHELLNSVPIGVLIVDRDGRIHFTNDVADQIIETNRCVRIRHGEIFFSDARQNRDILFAIGSNALSRATNGADDPSIFSVRKPDSDKFLLISVTRLAIGEVTENLGFDEFPVTVVYLCDPDIQIETSEQLLSRLFGLTASEAKVLCSLVGGNSVADTAQEHRLTVETVRSYLKRVFSKTGCRSQSELIRYVARSPAWLAHQNTPRPNIKH